MSDRSIASLVFAFLFAFAMIAGINPAGADTQVDTRVQTGPPVEGGAVVLDPEVEADMEADIEGEQEVSGELESEQGSAEIEKETDTELDTEAEIETDAGLDNEIEIDEIEIDD